MYGSTIPINCQLVNISIFISKKEKCYLITKEGSVFVEQLSSNREEADTKIALQIKHATLTNPGPVVVRFHSGDTDIPVLLMALFADTDQTIYLDNGHDNHRKVLDLGSCEMTIPMKKALLGLHPFFKKGKKTCWSILQKYPQFLDVCMELGTDWEPNEHIIAQLEEYVCKLFGQKKVRCVNIARQQIFWEKYDKDNRISDLSLTIQRQPPSPYPEIILCMQIVETVLQCYGDDSNSHSTWLDRKYGCNVGGHAIS